MKSSVPLRAFTPFVMLALLAAAACGDDDAAGASGSAAGSGASAGRGGARDAGVRDAGPADASAPPSAVCDVDLPTACVQPAPTFAEIQPIIDDRCLSCHDGKGKEWPLLDYAHVSAWSDQIRDAMRLCSMPPADAGIAMPSEEREQILHWIRCGSKP